MTRPGPRDDGEGLMEGAMSGGTAGALEILTCELIASHTRCPYPYLPTSGPCGLQGPDGPRASVFITIDSEVFGRLASAREPTWEAALSRICQELNQTQQARWGRENRWAAELHRGKGRG
jgi:hypothetical protein